MQTKIKLCGLRRECDIQYANEMNPDYIGFVFAKSKRQVSFDEAVNLKSHLDSCIKSVGVFVDEDIEKIVSLVKASVIDIVQLHSNEDSEYIAKLKSYVNVPIIKAISVKCKEDILKANSLDVDFLLLDSNSGGSGKTFDWSIDYSSISKPFFVAGGITIDNVTQAIAHFEPYGIDVSSSVETNSFKDREKIIKFITKIRNFERNKNL